MHLTKNMIIDSSVTILNTFGIADMTMRRVAKHLGVAPGALYWHIESKQALIVQIALRMLSSIEGSVEEAGQPHSWRAALARRAESMRDCFNSYRDGAEIISAALFDDDVSAILERHFSAALPSGISENSTNEAEAYKAEGSVDTQSPDSKNMAAAFVHYVLGSVIAEQSTRQLYEFSSQTSDTPSQLGTIDYDARFRNGVQLLINGIGTREGL